MTFTLSELLGSTRKLRDEAWPKDAPVIQIRLKPVAAKTYQVGDVVQLKVNGPPHTIVDKKGDTVYLVKGSFKKKSSEVAKPVLMQSPAVAGRRKIKLED